MENKKMWRKKIKNEKKEMGKEIGKERIKSQKKEKLEVEECIVKCWKGLKY